MNTTTLEKSPYATSPETLTAEQIESYQTRGFVHIPGIITPEEAEQYRLAALEIAKTKESRNKTAIFKQLVNVWPDYETMRPLTMHANVGAVAEKLAGVSLRLWHDQILIKDPHNNAATEFHQDQPYWPHDNAPNPISAWIALVDVPVERGCMTFLPGSQKRTELAAQSLSDSKSFFGIAPDLIWNERVTVPLKAGDCTFHHGRCAHMATPNFTDEPRVAHVVIFMDAAGTYSGKGHVVTDPLELTKGQSFEHPMFPAVKRG